VTDARTATYMASILSVTDKTPLKRDDIVQKVNPFKQHSLAKELDISIMDGKVLY